MFCHHDKIILHNFEVCTKVNIIYQYNFDIHFAYEDNLYLSELVYNWPQVFQKLMYITLASNMYDSFVVCCKV
jgi:hypothetical protein